MNPEYFEADPVDRSLAADVSHREEPDEDEDEEEDSNNDESDDEYEGYSEQRDRVMGAEIVRESIALG